MDSASAVDQFPDQPPPMRQSKFPPSRVTPLRTFRILLTDPRGEKAMPFTNIRTAAYGLLALEVTRSLGLVRIVTVAAMFVLPIERAMTKEIAIIVWAGGTGPNDVYRLDAIEIAVGLL